MGEQYLPNNRNYINLLNAIASVIATENNTTIKLSGYNKDVIFSDGTSDDEKTIILDKGESYIFETRVSDATANLDGLIGANLSADKPVSVTNGNFLSVAENKDNYDLKPVRLLLLLQKRSKQEAEENCIFCLRQVFRQTLSLKESGKKICKIISCFINCAFNIRF